MTHRRQEIRAAVVEILKAAVPHGCAVVRTRTRPTQANELPTVLVYMIRETSETSTLRGRLDRTASLLIEIRCAATVDLDDRIDALCEIVEGAMAAVGSFGRLALHSFLASTNIGLDGEGESRQGVAILEYSVTYRTP
ncbi:hypothetical protein FHS85_001752 [Rhodoligotrophos appendicifer]|uniref:hypothetical protein n=1 Tax=Rhodoligotrophos appendicifer TaxID=987056 RepID=UPI001184BA4D|nr:hypothetical protein [Rhodoligotrophos appendicifer]